MSRENEGRNISFVALLRRRPSPGLARLPDRRAVPRRHRLGDRACDLPRAPPRPAAPAPGRHTHRPAAHCPRPRAARPARGLRGTALVSEGQQLVTNLQGELENRGGAAAWIHTAWEWVRGKVPLLPPQEEAIARVTASVGSVAGFMASRAGGILPRRGRVRVRPRHHPRPALLPAARLRRLRPGPAAAAAVRPRAEQRLVTLAEQLVSASVTATLTIAVVQGLIGGITFALLGIRGAAVWGLVMGILSFLPLIGATLVWLPTAVWLLLSGSVGKASCLLAVGLASSARWTTWCARCSFPAARG